MRTALLSLALAVACGHAAPPPTPVSNHGGDPVGAHEPMATIERTECLGWCPVYKLTVYRDGAVEYEGERYVKTKGKATGSLGAGKLSALDALFQQHGYLALADKYTDYEVTDAPSVTTSYSRDGHTKRIEHYLGDGKAPKELGEVEEGIDRIVGVEQWIGTEQEREKMAHDNQP
jgi:hypothetical protein